MAFDLANEIGRRLHPVASVAMHCQRSNVLGVFAWRAGHDRVLFTAASHMQLHKGLKFESIQYATWTGGCTTKNRDEYGLKKVYNAMCKYTNMGRTSLSIDG